MRRQISSSLLVTSWFPTYANQYRTLLKQTGLTSIEFSYVSGIPLNSIRSMCSRNQPFSNVNFYRMCRSFSRLLGQDYSELKQLFNNLKIQNRKQANEDRR